MIDNKIFSFFIFIFYFKLLYSSSTTEIPIVLSTIINDNKTTNVTNNDLNKSENMSNVLSGSTIRKGKGKIVRIGHIGALNAMPNAELVLDMARKELWRDGILDDEFDVELINTRACGESFEGVAVAADMFHLQDVKAFIGPYCNAEMDAVSKMAAYWNVPIIGYMAASNTFSDKTIYKTLARVSIRTTNSLAYAVATTLKHYNWKNVAIVTNTGVVALERTVIKIKKQILF